MRHSKPEDDWFSWPLPKNVQIGANSWLYSSHAFLHYGSRLSEGVVIGNHTGIYKATFFDLGPSASVRIGNYCSIVGTIFNTNNRVIIGDYLFTAWGVTITDSAFATPQHQNAISSSDIVIGDNVWVGTHAIILGGVTIGHDSVIGAASVVDIDVPPFSVVAGNPARVIKTVQQ